MAEPAGSLPGYGPVLAAQVRYQLTLLLRFPRALLAGLILPGALLALQLGKVQHVGPGTATTVLAERVAGLVVFGTLSIAYLSHASGLVVAREDGVLRRWRATPLPSWEYFTGRMIATVLLADASGLILVLVGMAMAGLHVTAGIIGGLLAAVTLGALAAGLPAHLGALLRLGPAPAGARTARRGEHQPSFSLKNQGRGREATGGPATRPPPGPPAGSPPRPGGPRARPRRPAGRASARSSRPRC
jgi:hypothetical protein